MAGHHRKNGPKASPVQPPNKRVPSPVRTYSPGPLAEWFRRCCSPSISDPNETRSLVSADFDYSEISNREDSDENSSISSSTDDEFYADLPRNLSPLAIVYETPSGDVDHIRGLLTDNNFGLQHGVTSVSSSKENRWMVVGRDAEAVGYLLNPRNTWAGIGSSREVLFALLVVIGLLFEIWWFTA